MGVFRQVGRAVKAGTMDVAGSYGIARWWHVSRRNWLSFKRRCPVCGGGRMFPFTEAIEGKEYDFIGCSRCEHYEVADLSNSRDPVVAETLGRLRDLASKRQSTQAPAERLQQLRSYRLGSRVHFVLAALFLVGAIALLFVDEVSLLPPLNVTALAGLLFTHGLRFSYRHWQVENDAFYQPGAFRRWIKLGRWLI